MKVARAAEVRSNSLFMTFFYQIEAAHPEGAEKSVIQQVLQPGMTSRGIMTEA